MARPARRTRVGADRNAPLGGIREYSRENVGRYAARSKRRSSGLARKKVLLGAGAAVLAVVAAALIWFGVLSSNLANGSIITAGLRSLLTGSDVTKDPFYMLLLGTDGRPGDKTYRSDTIVLARIDPTSKQVTLVSIPRDTKVELDGKIAKINAAHTYGGAEGVVKAVNDLCGVKIAHYAEVSFDGMTKLVDALGGVEVDVPDRIDDPKAGNVVIEKGRQKLNGAQALAFCRSRAFVDGDYTRMRHQRIFLGALAKTILSDANIANIVPVMNSLSGMLATDLGVDQIVALANAMKGMDTNAMYSCNVPSTTATIAGVSYVEADQEALKKMMTRVDAGQDPQGPQTMGTSAGDGAGSTVGDLSNNTSTDYVKGKATTSSGGSGSSS